ncbi:helix-turn-helix domain-containing protein [Halomarina litorea]|uniref:helix-turn-helix domain-containing protein n=1 Tax=Halomarina litorea TaxID=2961595 RepID=UPI0020C2BEEC|nr:helix-turn-helix domain-containing protein [Halomarina sp. BCD28]
MRVIAAYRATSPDLMLAESLAATDVNLAVDGGRGASGDRSLRFWATGGDLDGFETAMADDRSVSGVEPLYRNGTARLYRGKVGDEAAELTPTGTGEGTALAARFADGWWHAETRFPTADALDAFYDHLVERGVTVDVQSVYDARERPDERRPAEPKLTKRQRETLELAYAEGFFEIPRHVTMGDLATAFDVSEQAISQRLRRAYARLVEAAVVD